MNCCSLKRVIFDFIFVIIILRRDYILAATRWQPSIIWDRLNPLLTWKCNWMNIPKLDTYNRVELICPKPYIVSAYRSRDISKASMYYKIFMRKLNTSTHTMKELRESLNNGSFCDPEHAETEELYTCVQNDPNGHYKLRIHSDENLHVGDITVIFSNTENGVKSEVNSLKKQCIMVLVLNVTQSSDKAYDMSYGKCFQPKTASSYSDIEKTHCGCRGNSSGKIKNGIDLGMQGPRKNVTKRTTPAPVEQSPRAPDNVDNFKTWAFFVGMAIGVAVGVVITLLAILFIRSVFVKKKDKNFRNNPRQNNERLMTHLTGGQCHGRQKHLAEQQSNHYFGNSTET